MVRVLVVSERWWPEGSGGELATYLITRILRDAGFEVTVIHGTQNPKAVDGVGFVYTALLSHRTKHALWLHAALLARERWFTKLVRWADVVYVPRFSYPVIPLAKALGKPVIVHLHDYQPVSYNAVIMARSSPRRPLFDAEPVKLEYIEKGLLRALATGYSSPLTALARHWVSQADKILCVSRLHCTTIAAGAPELAGKLHIAYNPLPKVNPPPDMRKESLVLFSGGSSYGKGFHVLLQAIPKLTKLGLEVAITGSLDSRSLKLLEAIRRRAKLKVFGRIEHGKHLDLVAKATGVLFPSVWIEPFGYVPMEAVMLGTIPVSSQATGFAELVEGTNLTEFLVRPNNPEDLVNKLEVVSKLNTKEYKDIILIAKSQIINKINNSLNKLTKIFKNAMVCN